MSETTTLLKVGSAELVLRLIEAGVPMRDFTLENPIRAIRDMSRDRSGQVKVALSNGRRISALELQTEYYEKVSEFVRRESLGTRTVDRVLDLWERTLRAVAEDKLALIDTEIDWAIKLKLLDRYSVKHKLGLADPRIAQLDLAYHDIRRSRGVFSLLEPRGLAARVTTDPAIFRAKVSAAADHPGKAPRRLHPGRPGRPQRLHRRLGAPEAQRPGAAYGALQGPVRGQRRAGRPADRFHARLSALRRTVRIARPLTCAARQADRGCPRSAPQ